MRVALLAGTHFNCNVLIKNPKYFQTIHSHTFHTLGEIDKGEPRENGVKGHEHTASFEHSWQYVLV